MIYETCVPRRPALRQYIELFWYIAQSGEEAKGANPKMIPDGGYHMVFNLGAPHVYEDGNGRRTTPKISHINANQANYATIRRSGDVEIVGVVFRPYGLHPFVKAPIGEVAGAVRNMEDLVGSRIHELEERLSEAADVRMKFAELEKCLTAWLGEPDPMRPDVRKAVELMIEHRGALAIGDVRESVNLGERSFERLFKTYAGVSPKRFSDIRRIHGVLENMRCRSDGWVDRALRAGFYDQPHFNRTFRRMVGATPTEYMKTRNLLSDLYNMDIDQPVIIGKETDDQRRVRS
ncbi:helix-turn-helix domain-containing protein [Paenibacillaceae bacterium WGS1546]|uniref:helix-turn-helix domain-containing protein n=1 Tax=Cohnella sp. WGS1546 TaxID=3366810 RepID=UPI00372D7F58